MMMCPVLSCYDPLATDFAIDLGIAMQLTNISRDVYEDAKMGRRYLPGDWVDNLTPDEITKGALTKDKDVIHIVKGAIQKTLTLADTYYHSGLSGLPFLPKRAQIAIAVAAHSYRQIGVQLQAQNLNWHEGRTVTSTITKAGQFKSDAYILPQSKPTYHDASLHDALYKDMPNEEDAFTKDTEPLADHIKGASTQERTQEEVVTEITCVGAGCASLSLAKELAKQNITSRFFNG